MESALGKRDNNNVTNAKETTITLTKRQKIASQQVRKKLIHLLLSAVSVISEGKL
jgi:hypothetical protein